MLPAVIGEQWMGTGLAATLVWAVLATAAGQQFPPTLPPSKHAVWRLQRAHRSAAPSPHARDAGGTLTTSSDSRWSANTSPIAA